MPTSYNIMGQIYWNQIQTGIVKPKEATFTLTLGREVILYKTDRRHLVDGPSLKIVAASIDSAVRRLKIVRDRFSVLDHLAWV